MIFARKKPEFYIKIARKLFSGIFFFGGGGTCHPLPPVSYAYGSSPGRAATASAILCILSSEIATSNNDFTSLCIAKIFKMTL